MTETKRSVVSKVICILMICTLLVSLAVPALAATSKTVNTANGSMQTVTIVTGSGLWYTLGTKKTTVTVTNTGNKPVTIYKNIGNVGFAWEGTLYPGQTKTYVAKGSGKKYAVKIQKSGGNTTVRVSTNAGYVY